eukprot:TRINITY_DN2847_c0_g1_i3.p1 TRINITY_DN2847_c0_g1~~TRINITY_DN2847_c0_g1_i3.p1  ORF type:complete len:1039 (-),score=297.49 TRINITY_DN2847_c0_g1_i3:13-3030(-)
MKRISSSSSLSNIKGEEDVDINVKRLRLERERSEEIEETVMLGTVEGMIVGLDPSSGSEKWNLHLGKPLFSTSVNPNDEEGTVLIPSSDDGSIFILKYDRKDEGSPPKIMRVPFVMEDLVANSPIVSNNGKTLFVGDKETQIFAIDTSKGRILKSFSAKGTGKSCPTQYGKKDNEYNNKSDCGNDSEQKETFESSEEGKNAVWMMVDYYTIRAFDVDTLKEKWNMSSGAYYSSQSFSFLSHRKEEKHDTPPSKILINGNDGYIHCFLLPKQGKSNMGNAKQNHLWSYLPSSRVISAYISGEGPALVRNHGPELNDMFERRSNLQSPSDPLERQSDTVVVRQTNDGSLYVSHKPLVSKERPQIVNEHVDLQISAPFLEPSSAPPMLTLPYPDDENWGTSAIVIGGDGIGPMSHNNGIHVEVESVSDPLGLLGIEFGRIGLSTMPVHLNDPESKRNRTTLGEDNNSANRRFSFRDIVSIIWHESAWYVKSIFIILVMAGMSAPVGFAYVGMRIYKRRQIQEKNRILEQKRMEEETKIREEQERLKREAELEKEAEKKAIQLELKKMKRKKKKTQEEPEEEVVLEEEPETKVGKLIVTKKALGLGQSGTVVYEGFLHNKRVAVKRMLRMFYTVAFNEIQLLLESDHPNVIRYFGLEEDDQFVYLALTFCKGSLFDWVERERVQESENLDSSVEWLPHSFQSKRDILFETSKGLAYLHSLNIVHQDLKPQNVLIDMNNRVRITDMGCSKKLEVDQSSFSGNAHSGSCGWQAPEIMSLKQESHRQRQLPVGKQLPAYRITKKTDVFSLGCLFAYVLTGGEHPFGPVYERESNIIKGKFNLNFLKKECGFEAFDLISKMLSSNPSDRPLIDQILSHPFFWDGSKKLLFLKDASDRLEIEKPSAPIVIETESMAMELIRGDWKSMVDTIFLDNLGEKFRKYTPNAIRCLLRVIRNKSHHYYDLPVEVQEVLGPLPNGFVDYFMKRFPGLFIHIYKVISNYCSKEETFQKYLQ